MKILVPIQLPLPLSKPLNIRAIPLVQSAGWLAQRSASSLHLMYVIEPHAVAPWADEIVTSPSAFHSQRLEGLLASLRDDARRDALLRLREVGAAVPKSVPVSYGVIHSHHPAHAVKAEATRERADLIVIGARADSYKFVFSGFSTALSLMAEADIPVMLVPESVQHPFTEGPLSFLITDDLRDDSAESCRGALSLAAHLAPAHVLHMHVNAIDPDGLHDLIIRAPDVVVAGRTADEILRKGREDSESALVKRAVDILETLRQDPNSYTARAYSGEVRATLKQVALIFRPSIIAFGRHRSLHRRPFSLGKMPFYAMLQLGCAIVVAP